MKRCIQTLSIICLALYFCIGTALAAVPVPHQTKETIVFDDGTYLEIVTTVEPSLTQSNTKKASKEYTYRLISSGEKVCTYIFYGTFSYNGSSSEAISATAKATVYKSGWTLESHDEYCSGKSAYGTAVFSGPSGDKTLGGSITCDKNGNIS